jgi:hypothetical protein
MATRCHRGISALRAGALSTARSGCGESLTRYDRDPKFAPHGEQVGNVVNELGEMSDEGATAAGLAETPLVETERVVASSSECLAHVFVAAGVFADAVHKQDCCFGSVDSPVPPELVKPIACCTEADRRCAHGRSN